MPACSRKVASRSSNAPNTRSVVAAGRLADARPQSLLGRAVQSAPGVTDDDDLLGPQELLAHDQRAHHILGRERTRVPDDVRVADAQPKGVLDLDPGIHAGDDRERGQGRRGQPAAIEDLGEAFVLHEACAGTPATRPGRSVTGARVGVAGRRGSGARSTGSPVVEAVEERADGHVAVARVEAVAGDPPERPERPRARTGRGRRSRVAPKRSMPGMTRSSSASRTAASSSCVSRVTPAAAAAANSTTPRASGRRSPGRTSDTVGSGGSGELRPASSPRRRPRRRHGSSPGPRARSAARALGGRAARARRGRRSSADPVPGEVAAAGVGGGAVVVGRRRRRSGASRSGTVPRDRGRASSWARRQPAADAWACRPGRRRRPPARRPIRRARHGSAAISCRAGAQRGARAGSGRRSPSGPSPPSTPRSPSGSWSSPRPTRRPTRAR